MRRRTQPTPQPHEAPPAGDRDRKHDCRRRRQPVSAAATPAPPRTIPWGRRWSRGLKGLAGVLLLLGAWQASVPLVGMSSYFYPSPTDVIASFAELIRKGILPVYLAD